VWSLGVILYQLIYDQTPPWWNSGVQAIRYYSAALDPNIPDGDSGDRQAVDTLVTRMLLQDPDRRISLPEAISVVEEIVLKEYSRDRAAEEIIYLNPKQRGAVLPTPSCLYDSLEHAKDIGDDNVMRVNCLDIPEDATGFFKCGMFKRSSGQCCKCSVKRHGKKVKGYFRMQQCQ